MTTPKYDNLFEEHLDDVDAAMFSGDMFLDMYNRRALRELISRWTRELERLEKEDQRDYK